MENKNCVLRDAIDAGMKAILLLELNNLKACVDFFAVWSLSK